jgi:GT2 family glycosyltransferase
MKVIFCVPGNTFSNRFVKCWTALQQELHKQNIEYELMCEYTPNIYYIRGMLLGGNYSLGPSQHPWQGKKEYDYIMWIDSDIVFKPQHFFKLLEHDKDMVSGLYLKKPQTDSMADIPTSFACFVDDDYRNLMTHEATGEVIEVKANGMGWMLVKKGVYEKIDYPWFGMINHHGEDLSFQLRAKDAGFDSYVDTSIIVGHEKGVVLDLF